MADYSDLIPRVYAPRIRKAIRLFNQHFPGWYNKVDLRTLDLKNCNNCVLGQLCGIYEFHNVVAEGSNNFIDAITYIRYMIEKDFDCIEVGTHLNIDYNNKDTGQYDVHWASNEDIDYQFYRLTKLWKRIIKMLREAERRLK